MAVTFDEARAVLADRLSEPALAHSDRVAQTAADLAAAYDADTEAARIAGLLHDWHRETSADELVERARNAGLDVTAIDLAVPYLLHGPLAAVELKAVFPGIREDVLEAIRAHTYGADPITPLDMIVYVADIIEPGRAHDGVAELRADVGRVSLEELFRRAYARSLCNLVAQGRRIHPATVSTWNRIVAGAKR